MTDLATRRKDLLSSSMDNIRAIIANQGETRAALKEVEKIVVSMTKEEEMFGHGEFPTPTPKEYAKIYLLSDDEGGGFSLYLISALPFGPSPVHDHGTFAVIAGIEGDEENTIYKRLDDGSREGHAELEEDYKVVLRKGDGIAFMPDDIHHICAVTETPTRHFHLYGKGFAQQNNKTEFNLKERTTKAVSGAFLPVDESRRIL